MFIQIKPIRILIIILTVADLRGGARDAHPPLSQDFFIFMQFSRKIRQIVGWRPPLGLAHTPLGNPGSATDFNIFSYFNFQ